MKDRASPAIDGLLLAAVCAQLLAGLAFACSASMPSAEKAFGNNLELFQGQVINTAIGLALAIAAYRLVSPRFLQQHATWLLVLALGLLLLPQVPGLGHTLAGARRWVKLGPWLVLVFPISMLLLVAYLGSALSRMDKPPPLVSVASLKIAVLVPLFVVAASLQPHVGGMLMVVGIIALMCLAAGFRKLPAVLILVPLISLAAYLSGAPYVMRRLSSFLDPFADEHGSGYQLSQSLTAIGGGDAWGAGLGNGVIKGSLPDAQGNFLFSSLVEESGAFGGVLVLLLSLFILWRCVRIALRLRCEGRMFEGLLVSGLTAWITLSTVAHVATVLGLVPGPPGPYPLLSFRASEGAYLWAFLIGFAVILKVGRTEVAPEVVGAAPANVFRTVAFPVAAMVFLLLGVVTTSKAMFDPALDRRHAAQREVTRRSQSCGTDSAVCGTEDRGRILDRFGKVLARSVRAFDIAANPADLRLTPAHLARVAVLLDLNPDRLLASFERQRASGQKFLYLRRGVDEDDAVAIGALHAPGIHTIPVERRRYPEGEVAAKLVGFTDVDGVGREGLELSFNAKLSAAGRGKDLRTTIDLRIQRVAHEALRSAVQKSGAIRGSAVVLDARTGEVLAMAGYPSFDVANPSDRVGDRVRNFAINAPMEPGAVLAPFTLISALTDLRRDGTRELNVKALLATYRKDALGNLAMARTDEEFHSVLSAAGFGTPTGLELRGEVPGVLKAAGQWSDADRAAIGSGFGVSATLVQIAAAYLLLANDGHPPRLTLEEGIELQRSNQPLLDPSAVRQTREAMSGSFQYASVQAEALAITSAGMAAWVPKVIEGRYGNRHRAIYAGFAPAEAPEVVVVVSLEEPGSGHQSVAEVSYRSIVEASLPYVRGYGGADSRSGPGRTADAATFHFYEQLAP